MHFRKKALKNDDENGKQGTAFEGHLLEALLY